jgi:uncharacterized protein
LKALLIKMLLAAASPNAGSEATLSCYPAESPLATAVCSSERLVERDRQVGTGLRVLIDADLPDKDMAPIATESDRLRARRDSCMRPNVRADTREACLIFAYDRWLERIDEWHELANQKQQLAKPQQSPSLTTPVEPPDLAAR